MFAASDLSKPFSPERIEWRVGSTNADKSKGIALAYIDARDVMNRLDEICGPENWQDRYEFHGKRTICYLSIRIGTDWITKADGAGDSDVEAEKGAISDALKRAAVKWGVGRYLYDLDSPWVELEPAGRSYKIKASEKSRLIRLLGGQAAPARQVENKRAKSGAYKTAAGFERQSGERLSDASEIAAVTEALFSNMQTQPHVKALDAWAVKQRTMIDTLPDAEFDEFRASYANHRADLKAEELVA